MSEVPLYLSEDRVLVLGPAILLDVGVQLVVPPLPALPTRPQMSAREIERAR